MKKGDVIIKPGESRSYYRKLNKKYATLFLGRIDSDTIKVMDFKGGIIRFPCREEEEPDWKIIGHIDMDYKSKILAMLGDRDD